MRRREFIKFVAAVLISLGLKTGGAVAKLTVKLPPFADDWPAVDYNGLDCSQYESFYLVKPYIYPACIACDHILGSKECRAQNATSNCGWYTDDCKFFRTWDEARAWSVKEHDAT